MYLLPVYGSLMKKLLALLVLSIALIPALVYAQKTEDIVINDLRSLGFEVEKGDGYYKITESGSMYDSPELPYMLSFTRNGKHEIITVAKPAKFIAAGDTSLLGAMYASLSASITLNCAGYAITELKDGTHLIVLQRSIENVCYSKGFLKQVIDCMKKELSTWSGYSAGNGLVSGKPADESNPEMQDILARYLLALPQQKK